MRPLLKDRPYLIGQDFSKAICLINLKCDACDDNRNV